MDEMNNIPQDQNPQGQPPVTPDRKGFAVASLVLGICGIVLTCAYVGLPAAIVGLIMGIMSRNSSKKGMALAGIILSSIGIVLSIIYVILIIIGVGILSTMPNLGY